MPGDLAERRAIRNGSFRRRNPSSLRKRIGMAGMRVVVASASPLRGDDDDDTAGERRSENPPTSGLRLPRRRYERRRGTFRGKERSFWGFPRDRETRLQRVFFFFFYSCGRCCAHGEKNLRRISSICRIVSNDPLKYTYFFFLTSI